MAVGKARADHPQKRNRSLVRYLGPFILHLAFFLSIIVQALDGATLVWTTFVVSFGAQLLTVWLRPNCTNSRLFRTLNSLTIVFAFVWLLFLWWSTREFCFSPFGMVAYAPVINEIVILSVIVLLSCCIAPTSTNRSKVLRACRQLLLTAIFVAAAVLFVWSISCKVPHLLLENFSNQFVLFAQA